MRMKPRDGKWWDEIMKPTNDPNDPSETGI